MSNTKKSAKSRGITQEFIKEVSDKISIISSLSKDSGIEIPSEIEETLKELSICSSKKLETSSYSESYDISSEINDNVGDLSMSSLSSSINSTNFKQIKENNTKICNAVKQKLEVFKSLNKKSRNDGVKANCALKSYHQELNEMKSSVIGIMEEANSTKEQIMKMKEKLEVEVKEPESPKYEDCDISLCKFNSPDYSNMLIEQIKDLHSEIYKIQSRIEKSEEELRSKESENQELKAIIGKLNDSFDKLDCKHEAKESEKEIGCQNCRVF